jgi:hypothetical protein
MDYPKDNKDSNAEKLGEELRRYAGVTGAKMSEEDIKKIIEDAAVADKQKQSKRAAVIKEQGDKIEDAASTAGNYNEEGFELRELKPKGGRKTKRRRRTKTRPTKTRRAKTRRTKTRRTKTRRTKTRRAKKNKPSRRLL